MVNVSVSRRYARALLDVAGASADEVLSQLDALVGNLEASRELKDVFSNPAYTQSQRLGVLEQLMAGAGVTHVQLINTLKLLNSRNRIDAVPDIARGYRALVDLRVGRVRGKVTSAVKLAPEALEQLEQSLEKATQRSVVLEAVVDPSLLGGATAQVGSVLYDGSLRNQLDALGRALKS
jgi:F-type H+-transporting ATPase subunit delta